MFFVCFVIFEIVLLIRLGVDEFGVGDGGLLEVVLEEGLLVVFGVVGDGVV